MSRARHQAWSLDRKAFENLLKRLSPDRDQAAARYEDLRSRLTRFFAWEGCEDPESHCDETLNRVARRLSEGEEVKSLDGYLFGAARLVLLESFKRRQRTEKALDTLTRQSPVTVQPTAEAPPIACLRLCLEQLPSPSRTLILRYYRGERGLRITARKNLAEELGVPINALRNRALRTRKRLEECVRKCLQPKSSAISPARDEEDSLTTLKQKEPKI